MQNGQLSGLRRWREFLIVLVFWVALSVTLDLSINAIAALGVGVAGVVVLITLGVQTARGRP